MISDLERPHLDRITQAELQARLAAAPWCWPLEEHPDLFDRARQLTGAGPPTLPPGCVPLVAVEGSGDSASLWMLALNAGLSSGDAELESDSIDAWKDAATVLPRCLPLLWRPVRDAYESGRYIRHLVSLPLTRMVTPRARELRGRSFGLSFVLAMASKIVGQRVPADLIASAVVDADGHVAAVEGMREKIAVIEECAPRLRRLLVCSSQEEEARRMVQRLEVVPVGRAAEAVEIALGDALRTFIRRSGSDDESRSELVDSFFRLAMLGRGAAIDWTPVERGARSALESWTGLDTSSRWKLEVTEAVATRHEDNRGHFPIPSVDVLDGLPRTLRIAVVTHLVQHSADTGAPQADAARKYAAPELFPIESCFTPQLKLWGAIARLAAVTGRPEESLALQEQLAHALLARLEYEEISYQMSEWYRLAGALSDEAAFGRATEMHRQVERLGGLGLTGSIYVELSRARAQVCLGIADSDGPEPKLRALASDARVTSQVRWSATRWLVRWLAYSGREAECAAVLEPLATSAVSEIAPRRVARSRHALVHLDDAVRRSSHADAMRALEAIHELDPGPVGQLMRAANASGCSLSRYVSLYYPY